jgi:autotransporter-associated beta strand protein
MKSKRLVIQTAGSAYLKTLLAISAAGLGSLRAATVTWDGNGTGATDLGTALNWTGDALPSVSTPDTAVWDGSVTGPLSLVYSDAAFAGTTGNLGLNLSLTSGQTSALSLDSGANTSSLRLNNVTLDAGAGIFTLGDSANTFNITLGGATGQTHTWTNNSSSTATVNSDVKFGLGAGGNHALLLTGSGNWVLNNSLTSSNGGNFSIFKTGSGMLTLSGGGTVTGGVTAYGGAFGAVFREGTTKITGGTYTSASEIVVGGNDTAGGAGANTNLTMDAGTFTITNWLSVGRGNGTGSVSSDLVLNNSAAITASNMSAGYNAGSASNLPKGTITLNNTSSLTISSAGAFLVGESAGSNMTMTLNDSATVSILGNGTAINRNIGGGGTGTLTLNGTSTFTDASTAALNIGYQNGTGIVNVNGGTFNHTAGEVRVGGANTNGTFTGTGTLNVNSGSVTFGALTIARSNSNTASISGYVNVAGGTLTSTGDVIVGYAGAGNLGQVNITGGTFNVGTTAAKWMQVGTWDTTRGEINISNGNLNLNSGSAIKMNRQTGTGANIITMSGGNVTYYSDNATTVGGTGDLDLQYSGAAGSNNTFNLNGGTLTVPKVTSTATTGTRTFNFNGGTLKATAASTTFFNLGSGTGTARANVRNGGAIINSNSYDVTIAQALVHSNIGGDNATDGGLSKTGGGKLTLTGASTYTGATTINAGTLALGSSGSIDNSSGVSLGTVGTFDVSAKTSGYTVNSLSGSGSVIGNLTVSSQLAIGNSPGTVNFSGNLSLATTATYLYELTGGGSTADLANVTGSITLGSGTILDLVQLGTYTQGDKFTIAGYTSGLSGTFSGLANNSTFTDAGGDWLIKYDDTSAGLNGGTGTSFITITAVPEPAQGLIAALGMLGILRRRRI